MHHADALQDRVVSEQGEVHVRQRLAGMEIASHHLDNGLDIPLKAGKSDLRAKEEDEGASEDDAGEEVKPYYGKVNSEAYVAAGPMTTDRTRMQMYYQLGHSGYAKISR